MSTYIMAMYLPELILTKSFINRGRCHLLLTYLIRYIFLWFLIVKKLTSFNSLNIGIE